MARPNDRAVSVILDCEAVQALMSETHPKHQDALATIVSVASRRPGQRRPPRVIVPVAVRVESGWVRTQPGSALVSVISHAADWPLTQARADEATRLRLSTGVSVVDATVGQAAHESDKPVAIVTSDVGDMRRLADHIDGTVRVARI